MNEPTIYNLNFEEVSAHLAAIRGIMNHRGLNGVMQAMIVRNEAALSETLASFLYEEVEPDVEPIPPAPVFQLVPNQSFNVLLHKLQLKQWPRRARPADLKKLQFFVEGL